MSQILKRKKSERPLKTNLAWGVPSCGIVINMTVLGCVTNYVGGWCVL